MCFNDPFLVVKKNSSISIFLLLLGFTISNSVFAQVIWDGGAGSTNWSDPNNWDPDGLPTASDIVSIGNSAFVVIQAGDNFTINSLTLTGSTLNINGGGQLNIAVGGTYAFTLDNGTFNNNGTLDISNCTHGIRLMGTTSSLDNNSTISVDNHNGNGLLFSSGCTSCMVNNNGSFYFDNGASATSPTIFYQVSGNHFNNLGLLDIGATANAGVGIGLGATASGSLQNSGTLNIHNTGAGRAGISVGFLGGSFVNNAGATLNLGAGIGGTWAGGFNMALTNNGTININKAGTVSVVATGTGVYDGAVPFDNSNNVSPSNTGLGCLQFNSGYTNTVGSPVPVTSIQIGGTTSCSGHDKISVVGNATIGGTLTISLANGFTPSPGESFTILEASSRSGFYSTINYPTVSGISWTTSYTATGVTANAQSSLPVELVDFRAKELQMGMVNLTWSTASESNNAGFEVESSQDGRIWESIGFVAGHGYSDVHREYQFTDYPEKGIESIYYRLRQMDSDGRWELSKVVSVELSNQKSGAQPSISPNPTTGHFEVRGMLPTDGKIAVYDHTGRLVLDSKDTAATQYDIGHLRNGIYTLVIYHQNGASSLRLAKQD